MPLRVARGSNMHARDRFVSLGQLYRVHLVFRSCEATNPPVLHCPINILAKNGDLLIDCTARCSIDHSIAVQGNAKISGSPSVAAAAAAAAVTVTAVRPRTSSDSWKFQGLAPGSIPVSRRRVREAAATKTAADKRGAAACRHQFAS